MKDFPMTKTIIHLLSGGMDSVVMLYDLRAQGHNVHCLLFNYRQRHAKELEFAKLQCERQSVLWTQIDLPLLRGSELTDGSGGVVVPNRNAILLSHAVNVAVAAGADIITYGCNKDDEAVFPDCRMAFIQEFNRLLLISEIRVEVCAPYIDKTKAWIARLGSDLRVPLGDTWSCYRGGDQPCGVCAACLKRKEAETKASADGFVVQIRDADGRWLPFDGGPYSTHEVAMAVIAQERAWDRDNIRIHYEYRVQPKSDPKQQAGNTAQS